MSSVSDAVKLNDFKFVGKYPSLASVASILTSSRFGGQFILWKTSSVKYPPERPNEVRAKMSEEHHDLFLFFSYVGLRC